MSKKEKVNFVRTDDFQSMDEALNVAMSSLEETNQRIADLLVAETERPEEDEDKAEISTDEKTEEVPAHTQEQKKDD